MASSATTTLRMELMATGENDTTWGTKINANFQIMESAILGTTAVSTTGGNSSELVASSIAQTGWVLTVDKDYGRLQAKHWYTPASIAAE